MPPSDSASPIFPSEKGDSQTLLHPVTDDIATNRSRFQSPQIGILAKHTAYCVAAGPVLYYTVHGANVHQMDINQFRLLTNAVTTVLGILLSSTLMEVAVRHLHASTWATVLEAREGRNVTVNELDGLTTGGLVTAPLNLLVRRSTKDRKQSRYPWTLNIFIYLTLIGFAKGLAFLLERTFAIDAYLTQQPDGVPEYVSVLGGLSPQDISWVSSFQQALQAGNRYQLSYIEKIFSSQTQANSIRYPSKNHSIFFPEVLPGQLLPNAQGPANITQGGIPPSLSDTTSTPQPVAVADTPLGQLVRWPRWGIRIACQSLPDPTLHLLPLSPSGHTYIYLPTSLIGSLAADLQVSIRPLAPRNVSVILQDSDALPSGLDPSTIYNAYVTQNDGSSHSGYMYGLDGGTRGQGWMFVDLHLIRIDTAITPNGSFPVTALVNGSQIGYDAVVCLETVEPWIVDAYNITGRSPYTTQVLRSGNTVDAFNETLHPGVASVLDSSNISTVYLPVAYFARMDMMASVEAFYAPAPILVDFTGNSGTLGPGAYTKLSPSSMETVIGGWDSSRALPLLIGTEYIAAQARTDRIIGSGRVNGLYLGLVLGSILLVGIIADVCIPRLPGGVPLRDFGALSSITVARPALHRLDTAMEYTPDSEVKQPLSSGGPLVSPGVGPEFHMDLDVLKEKIGDTPTYYAH